MTKTVWVIRDGVWIQYERTGECVACGDCCRKFNYRFSRTTVSVMDPEQEVGEKKDIGKWEGWAIENWDNPDEWVWWGPMEIVPIDEPKCKRFDPGTNLCEKFGAEDWKEICRKFPFRPEDLAGIENCGFTFRGVI